MSSPAASARIGERQLQTLGRVRLLDGGDVVGAARGRFAEARFGGELLFESRPDPRRRRMAFQRRRGLTDVAEIGHHRAAGFARRRVGFQRGPRRGVDVAIEPVAHEFVKPIAGHCYF